MSSTAFADEIEMHVDEDGSALEIAPDLQSFYPLPPLFHYTRSTNHARHAMNDPQYDPISQSHGSTVPERLHPAIVDPRPNNTETHRRKKTMISGGWVLLCRERDAPSLSPSSLISFKSLCLLCASTHGPSAFCNSFPLYQLPHIRFCQRYHAP